jgi:hypothetical protein
MWCSVARTLRILSSPKPSVLYLFRCETWLECGQIQPYTTNLYSAHSGYNDPIESSHELVTQIRKLLGESIKISHNFLQPYIHVFFLLACLTSASNLCHISPIAVNKFVGSSNLLIVFRGVAIRWRLDWIYCTYTLTS